MKQLKLVVTFWVIAIFGVSAGSADSFTLSKVYQWGTGSYSDVAIKGKYAYCAATGAGMDVIDISNPAHMVKVADFHLIKKNIEYIEVSGNFAYIIDQDYYGSYELVIIDISNPLIPIKRGSYFSDQTTVYDFTISGNYVFLSHYYGSVDIINISNPDSPVKVGSYSQDQFTFGFHIQVQGNYLYLLHARGFHIVDISTPSQPFLSGSYLTNSTVWTVYASMAITGNIAFIGSRDDYLLVLDITNPASPKQIGTWGNRGKNFPYILGINNNRLYMYESSQKFNIYDISDPVSPLLLGSCHFPHAILTYKNTNYIEFSANKAYFAANYDGLHAFDISDPAAPQFVSQTLESSQFINISIDGIYAHAIGIPLTIFDISNPQSPQLINKTSLDSRDGGLVVNQIFYNLFSGFDIYNLSNPLAPELIYVEYTVDETYDVEVNGNYAYFMDNDHGLIILDISNLDNITNNYQDFNLYGTILAVKDKYLYLFSEGFKIFDIYNPAELIVVGEINSLNGGKGCIDSSSHYAYAANANGGFHVLDISNPTAPAWIQTVDTPGVCTNLTISGNHLFVADGKAGLHVYNISNPATPSYVCGYLTTGFATDVNVKENYVYLVEGTSGKFTVLQITNKPNQTLNLISPNGHESWSPGTSHLITWSQTNLDGQVTIDLIKNGTALTTIASPSVATGSFTWDIPQNLPPGNDYKIRINCGSVSDQSDSYFSITTTLPPTISLNKQALNFYAIHGYADLTSSPQSVQITHENRAFNWTASTTQSWINFSPSSGTSHGSISISIDSTGLREGNYSGTVSISAPTASNSPQDITVNLVVYHQGQPPFGEFATPQDGSAVYGSIPLTGWALDDIEVQSLKIFRNPVAGEGNNRIFIGDALFVEGARPDVESAYPNYPQNSRAGWGYMLLTYGLPNQGNGTYTFYAICTDKEGHEITLGQKTITCDNASSVKPFGTIDTPFPGETTSGKQYINFGWALTPLPNTIPFNGSTITVWVDGQPVGHPVYNQHRVDIATLFPEYNNANGAVGFFQLDTTSYANGLHTISWSVTDDANKTEGIGSRFFNIANVQGETDSQSLSLPNIFTDDFIAYYPGLSLPIQVKLGFQHNANTITLYPQEDGLVYITMKELGRIEIDLTPLVPGKTSSLKHPTAASYKISGYITVGNTLKPLPIGSTLDTQKGIFYWQPGPGFIGVYRLTFVEHETNNTEIIEINIIPHH